MRCAAATSALIEQNETVLLGTEQPPHPGCTPRTWTTVHRQCRYAIGIAAGLPIETIAVPDVEQARLVRLDRRVQASIIPHTARPYRPQTR